MIRTLVLAFVALASAIAAVRWIEEGDYYDPFRGRRHCAATPPAVARWAATARAPQPGDQADLGQWLDEHAADINRLFGAFCLSALHTAARFGRDDLVALLVTRGADVHVRNEPRAQTPLHLAAQYGHEAVAARLLSSGADANATTKFGRTALHEAAFGLAGTAVASGRLAVARLLLARGADVNARERGSGFTPLDQTRMSAANQAGQDAMAALLIAAGGKAQASQ
jgi:ankyrin repeat protein